MRAGQHVHRNSSALACNVIDRPASLVVPPETPASVRNSDAEHLNATPYPNGFFGENPCNRT